MQQYTGHTVYTAASRLLGWLVYIPSDTDERLGLRLLVL